VVAAEARANAVVTENRPVEVSFEDAASAGGLRKESGREGTLRIVTIRDLDRSACGGTHVRATGEIGPIQIRKIERVRKSVRLEFLCGQRTVRRARTDLDLLARLAVPYSAAAEELPPPRAPARRDQAALAAAALEQPSTPRARGSTSGQPARPAPSHCGGDEPGMTLGGTKLARA
jgi:alanyl-tRNA synthetase